MSVRSREQSSDGDLSVTALYTSAAWAWGNLPNAGLLASVEAERVFRVVNAVLAVARPFFARKPSLAHSLLHRHTMIDHLLSVSASRRVLELASGLSRRGVTFSAEPDLRYVEVDLPHVVDRKRALLARSDEGRVAMKRSNWKIVKANVATLDLATIAPNTPDERLFVIAEGLLMYFEADAQRVLFASIAKHLRCGVGGSFVFDLVPVCEQPRPGALGRALEWLMKRFTGGKAFVRDARTRDDITAELRASGFTDVELIEPKSVAKSWHLPFPETNTQQLVFVAHVAPIPAHSNEA
jgi:O-methyltransferase involved in polyketide biosynthesis